MVQTQWQKNFLTQFIAHSLAHGESYKLTCFHFDAAKKTYVSR